MFQEAAAAPCLNLEEEVWMDPSLSFHVSDPSFQPPDDLGLQGQLWLPSTSTGLCFCLNIVSIVFYYSFLEFEGNVVLGKDDAEYQEQSSKAPLVNEELPEPLVTGKSGINQSFLCFYSHTHINTFGFLLPDEIREQLSNILESCLTR